MADSGLALLYRLHRVDEKIQGLRAKAGSLDPGKEATRRLKEFMKETDPVRVRARKLKSQIKDTRSELNSSRNRHESLQERLYSGKVNNPKEVEAIESEIASLKQIETDAEAKLARLQTELEPIEAEANKHEDRVKEFQKEIIGDRRKAVAQHERIKEEHQKLVVQRPKTSKSVPPVLLNQYEALRKRLDGIAMAVVTDDDRCGFCGVKIPAQAIEALRSDRLTQCEGCRRILFIPLAEAEAV